MGKQNFDGKIVNQQQRQQNTLSAHSGGRQAGAFFKNTPPHLPCFRTFRYFYFCPHGYFSVTSCYGNKILTSNMDFAVILVLSKYYETIYLIFYTKSLLLEKMLSDSKLSTEFCFQ